MRAPVNVTYSTEGGIARSALAFGGVCDKQTPGDLQVKKCIRPTHLSLAAATIARSRAVDNGRAAPGRKRERASRLREQPVSSDAAEMGSTDKAVITGFICRLCSKMNRFVIHIYGEEGERMKLAEKINTYLPITVNMNDPLPKTACLHCIERLEAHHELMEQIMFTRRRLNTDNKTTAVASSSATTVDTAPTSSPPPC
ncbi:PREDICTED: uncharacterized protein LOC105558111 [Vollenhovia emeryi]|uniref:uncharacterized protein LOC105558111 n=1 Tax=Vollenhovia emeryi TaxID=411798 RepID=UPI0005F3E8C8|nr:PREDICTED: uncharacterized protein LOC105558111 [Vollenhovia emeryi]